MHGTDEILYKLFVGKPKGQRPLRRPRHRWEDNNGMDLGETGWEVMGWIHLSQERE
jgi:hypothetical protein